jgi:sugar lactone lactonase YvrE
MFFFYFLLSRFVWLSAKLPWLSRFDLAVLRIRPLAGKKLACSSLSRSVSLMALSLCLLTMNFVVADAQNVGATSGTLSATVTITTAGIASEINVLTQGAVNLDFKFVSGGSCSATGAYSVNATCTVKYTFSPSHPGTRYGGVTITNSTGTILGQTRLTGIGTGPQVTFAPASGAALDVLNSSFGYAYGVAVDGSGNVYVADSSNNAVKEVPVGCTTSSCITTLGGGFNAPYSMAIDGTGNLYIADSGDGAVKEMPLNCTSSSCVVTLGGGFTTPWGVAVDGSGNIYVADFNASKVFEMPPGCASANCVTTLGGGFQYPAGVAVDGSGNVFVANNYYQASSVQKMTPNCFSTSCVTTIGGGFYLPYNVAVDGSGNVYVADYENGLIKEMSPTCGSANCVTALANMSTVGLTVDGSGNVYASDYSQLIKIDLHDPPTVYFASTPYGYTSTDSPEKVTVFNNGNASLNATGLNVPSMFSLSTGTGYCTASSQIAANSSCTLGMSFSPSGSGSGDTVSSDFILSDNNLNATSSQSIPVEGVALSDVPTVTNLAPNYGSVAGGTTVTITGTLLLNATAVKFGTTAASSFTVNSATSITATSPTGTADSTVDVTVTTSYGISAASSADLFTFFVAGAVAPTENVGTTSPTQTATVRITATGTASSINVLTLGVANQDFKLVSGGTCSATGSYNTVGATCTVEYTFTPSHPGTRYGGINLTNSAGTVLGEAFVTGVGNGPQAAFAPATGAVPTIMGGMFSYPYGIAVDATGDVYVADNVRTVLKVPAGCGSSSCVTTLGGGFNYPEAIAVDGSGEIYVADFYGQTVNEMPANCASASCVTKLGGGWGYPSAIAVDGSGNVYVTDASKEEIFELPAGCTSSACVTQVTGFSQAPEGVAVDGGGNLYTVIGTTGQLQKRPAGCTASACVVTLGGGMPFYGGATVSVDAVGNVYVSNAGYGLFEMPSTCMATSCVTTVSNSISISSGASLYPESTAVDSGGNLYVLSGANFNVYKVDYFDPPPLAFATTGVGSTSSDSPKSVILSNDGNAPLTVSGLSSSNVDFVLSGSTCTAGSTLMVGGSCIFSTSFEPLSGHSSTGYINIIDNTVPVEQQVAVSGIGIIGTTPQTITFPQPTSPLAINTVLALNATSTSGLAVTYSVISGPGTLSGSTLSATSVGSVVVEADQIGNATYAAATPVRITVATAAQTVAVGTKSSTFEALVTISAGGTLGSVNVLTKGASGGDYAYVSGGTCTVGVNYSVGQTCTAEYTFTPSRPGTRPGAVSLTNNAATPGVMGTVFLSATGVGPLATFPGTTSVSTIATGFYNPSGIALDGHGDVFVADTVYGLVKEIVAVDGVIPANATIITLPTPSGSFADPGGVAVDGSGNLFVTDEPNNLVWEYVAVNGIIPAKPTIVSVGGGSSVFTHPESLAVDANGDVFVSQLATIGLKEIVAANGVLSTTATTVGTGVGDSFGVAVDGSGDVFVSDDINNVVKEIVAVNGTLPASPQIVSLGSGIGAPIGVAVDSAGDVFVYVTTGIAPIGSFTLNEIVAVNGAIPASPTIRPIGSGIGSRSGLAVDGDGHLFVADYQNSVVKEIDLTSSPTLAFGSTPVGTPVTQTTMLQNAGNAILTLSSAVSSLSGYGSGYFTLNPPGTTTPCSTGATVTESEVCNVALAFSPQGGGSFIGAVDLTDNSLNAAGNVQQVPFTATATTGSAAQTITFPQPKAGIVGGSATLTATSSSGLAVTYTITGGTGSATISGSIITYTAPGTIVIAANQYGNSAYAAAATVSATVTVIADYVWLVNSNATISRLSDVGSLITNSGMVSTISNLGGIAIDASGNTWSVTKGSGVLSFTTNTGNSSSTFSGGGLNLPVSLAVDGNGYIWVANSGNNSVSEFSNAGTAQSGTAGYGQTALNSPSSVVLDNAGGVWITNKTGNSVTHIFGAAAPVLTPLSMQVTNSALGSKP